jgi:hypothetical protein
VTEYYFSVGVPARDLRAWGQARYSMRLSLYSEILNSLVGFAWRNARLDESGT